MWSPLRKLFAPWCPKLVTGLVPYCKIRLEEVSRIDTNTYSTNYAILLPEISSSHW